MPTVCMAADMDGDGDIDVVSAASSYDRIEWYENDGSEAFATHWSAESLTIRHSVFAADIDGDGDLDVLSASYSDNTIAWYENVRYDFGDAPASYPTTLAEDGARHARTGPNWEQHETPKSMAATRSMPVRTARTTMA